MKSYTLIISEKPSVASAIAACLGKPQKKEGYFEVNHYLVTWALGHLIELFDAEDYNQRYRRWSLDTLPIMPEFFRLKPRKDSRALRQYDIIRDLIRRPDVDALINACDAGREGELIFRYLYHHTEAEQPVQRLWLSSVVPDDIRTAFNNLKPEAEYDQLAAAASARSESDWLVGINATRAYTVRCNTLLQLGRVQTPTLALIVNRENEILSFLPTDFWEVKATLESAERRYEGLWTGQQGSRISAKGEAQAIVKRTKGQPGTITLLEAKETKELPPLLYNLTDLQKDANRRYGYSAQKTLQIAQSLYEHRKLITYPRTDSHHLNRQVFNQSEKILKVLHHGPYRQQVELLPKPRAVYGRRIVDENKVTDHHAIIPTTHPFRAHLPEEELRVYQLIVLRFLSVFCQPARYDEVRAETTIAKDVFVSKGKTMIDPGFRILFVKSGEKEDEQDEHSLPLLKQGAGAKALDVKDKKSKTKPPSRFTEGSLLGAMETAGRILTDDALKEAMKDKGIGTVASRPQIIEKLKSAGYITLKKRLIHPTEKGIELIASLPTRQLTSPELTGEWEYRLRKIERGQDSKNEFMKDIRTFTETLVQDARAMKMDGKTTSLNKIGVCPLCNADVGENRKAYSCSKRSSGCPFVVWKKIAGKTITPSQVRRLLNGTLVGPLKGFRSKTGKSFAASLTIKEGRVEFVFNQAGQRKK